MPSLILIKSPGGLASGTAFPLSVDTTVLGREDGCEVVIPNNAVSRRHAQIIFHSGGFRLQDLDSRNKTYLNNQAVEPNIPVQLKHDDRLKICDYLFRFHDERSAPAARSTPVPGDPHRGTQPLGAADDDDSDNSSVQHTVSRGAAQQFLGAQPSERLRVLLDISTTLAKTLELEPLMPQIAETLFGVFRQADRCFIILVDAAGNLVPKAVKNRRAGRDDERFSKTIVRRCLESGQAYITEDAGADSALGAAASIAAIQIRSAMCVPLMTSEGKPLGAIQLDTHDFTKKFKPDDLNLLTIVANFASIAVEKAQNHHAMLDREKQQREIEIARDVQLGFLPEKPPELPGYEFFAFYSAAKTVGGDYYDFIPLPDGRMAVVIGDVAGKGVPASLLMAKLSAEGRYSFLTQPTPADAVNLLNEQLIKGGIGHRFVTFTCLVLDPSTHHVTLVNAGHINPIRANLSANTLADAISDAESGVPLGLMSGYPYEEKCFTLEPNEVIVLMTDGVTDANDPQDNLFNLSGVNAALSDDTVFAEATPAAVGNRLVKAVKRHMAGTPQADDIAIVTFGRCDGSAGSKTGIHAMSDVVRATPSGTSLAGAR